MSLTTKAGKRSRTPSTARGILNMIDRFLSSPEVSYIEQRSLWNILSAIRGPDVGTGKSLAVQVRAKAFPRLAAMAMRNDGFAYGASFSFDGALSFDGVSTLSELNERRDVLADLNLDDCQSSHFSAHVSAALRDLEHE